MRVFLLFSRLFFRSPPSPPSDYLRLVIIFGKDMINYLDGEAEPGVFIAEHCDGRLVCVKSVIPLAGTTELVLAHEPEHEEYLRVSIAIQLLLVRKRRERTYGDQDDCDLTAELD